MFAARAVGKAGFHVQLGYEGYGLLGAQALLKRVRLREYAVGVKAGLPALRFAISRLHSFLSSKRGKRQAEEQAGASEARGLHKQIGKIWLAFLESLLAYVRKNDSAFDQLKMMKYNNCTGEHVKSHVLGAGDVSSTCR